MTGCRVLVSSHALCPLQLKSALTRKKNPRRRGHKKTQKKSGPQAASEKPLPPQRCSGLGGSALGTSFCGGRGGSGRCCCQLRYFCSSCCCCCWLISRCGGVGRARGCDQFCCCPRSFPLGSAGRRILLWLFSGRSAGSSSRFPCAGRGTFRAGGGG